MPQALLVQTATAFGSDGDGQVMHEVAVPQATMLSSG
jgi:hypothetical protein